jgi:nucleoside-diphosphate-sugar epimerase
MTDQTDLHVVLGTGPAGSTLAAHLADQGHRVRAVDRSGKGGDHAGVEAVAADLTHPEAAEEVTAGAEVIYHCLNVPYHLQVELLPGITTSVLADAKASGARLVVLDTLYPYGTADGERITEDTPWAATSRKGRLRADLDRRYLEAHEAGAVRVAAGRSADFFGPGVLNSTLGGAVFPGALTGQTILAIGDIDLPHSYTYIRDVARGLAALGENPAGDGRIWHLPTVPATTTRHVHELIEERVGRPLDVHTLERPEPWGPFDEAMMAEYAEMFYQHTIPQNMVSSAFEAEFGVHPTPLPEALDATVEWYRRFLEAASAGEGR